MRRFSVFLVASLFLLSASATAQTAGHGAGHVLVTPSDLKWLNGPPSIPGAKQVVLEGNPREPGPFTMRLLLPAGSKIPPHTHPGIEHVTVLSGMFNIGTGARFDSEKVKPLPPGSLAVLQPGTPHFVWVKEETAVQLHGMGPWEIKYVNPEDDPTRKK